MEIKTILDGLDPYKAKVEKAEAEEAKTRRSKSDAADAGGDKVSLSAEAKLRTEAYKTAQATPEVRQEKVATLKALVESGEYQVDSRKIAEKLIKDELDLF